MNLVSTLQAQGGGSRRSYRIDAESAAGGHLIQEARCLTARERWDGETETFITHSLTAEGFDASEDGTGRGTPLTTQAFSENQRGEVLEHDYSHQLTSGGGKPGQGYQAARIGSAVRRLTPTECERLQSWPDGWTLPEGPSLVDVPQALARLADPHDPQPDGPRYAACGDGVTSNVAEWIARRLLAYEAEAVAA